MEVHKLEEEMKALKLRIEECKKHHKKKINEECDAKLKAFNEDARLKREARLKEEEAKAKAEEAKAEEAKAKTVKARRVPAKKA
jgi:hypothetical protein